VGQDPVDRRASTPSLRVWRAVRVDMVHLARGESGGRPRPREAPGPRPCPSGCGEGWGGGRPWPCRCRPAARGDGVRARRVAGARFQDEDAGGLGHHEAVAVGVEGPRGGGGILGARQRPQFAKTRRRQGRVRRLRPAGDHDVAPAARRRSRGGAIAVAPDAHAVDVTRLGPRAPWPARSPPRPCSGSASGSNNGDTVAAPCSSSLACCFSQVAIPPMLHPMTTPTRAPSHAPVSSPASASGLVRGQQCKLGEPSSRKTLRRPSVATSSSATEQQKSTGSPARAGLAAARVELASQTCARSHPCSARRG